MSVSERINAAADMRRPAVIYEAKSLPRYEYIDALRGIAFLGVLVVHAALTAGPFRFYQIAMLGNQGVQLFFIASALTLFLSFKARSDREVTPVRNFFIRRFFRIAPLFWFGIVLYSIVPVREHVDREFTLGFWHYLSTGLFLHGWHVETMNTVVPGGWSIAVEMMFYLTVPLLWSWIRSIEGAIWWLLVSLLLFPVIEAICIKIFQLDTGDMLDGLYLQRWLPAQAPVFLLGILLYHVIQHVGVERKSARDGILLLSIAAFVIVNFRTANTLFVPAWVAICIGLWCFALALHLWPTRFIVNPLTRFIGKVSYSAYITHFAILFIVCHFIPPSSFGENHIGCFFFLVAIVLPLTLAISWVTYSIIEVPGERAGRAIIRRLEQRDS
jgi:peptidoglycan/LPS O-acetylase OafA/YrhL